MIKFEQIVKKEERICSSHELVTSYWHVLNKSWTSRKQVMSRSVVCSSWPAQHVLLFSWLTDIQTQKYRSMTLFMKKVIVSMNSTSAWHPLSSVSSIECRVRCQKETATQLWETRGRNKIPLDKLAPSPFLHSMSAVYLMSHSPNHHSKLE